MPARPKNKKRRPVSGRPALFHIKRCLLSEATQNARLRAEQLAVNSGGKVGALRAATQDVFQITPLYSTDVDDWGRYDTTTIEKAVKAVVTIQHSTGKHEGMVLYVRMHVELLR